MVKTSPERPKVVLNASYGVFGAERFALYCPPVCGITRRIGTYDVQLEQK